MMNKTIIRNIEHYQTLFGTIPITRKSELIRLARFVQDQVSVDKANLIFICTHNSRRSHISQLWAQTAASYYGISNVVAYSGGTEATAFNPRAVKVMQDLGFFIAQVSAGSNPIFEAHFDDSVAPVQMFSKVYDQAPNPSKDFAAIMTCSHAEQYCPIIHAAKVRIVTPYEDPKDFDDTPFEDLKYVERAHEIGRDLLFAFSQVKLFD